MKNKLLIICCIFSLFWISSCSKDSPSDDLNFFFKMKVDGDLKEYGECKTWFGNIHRGEFRYYQMNILASDENMNLGGVFVNDASPIKKGLYTSEMIQSQTMTPMAGLGGFKENGSNDVYMSNFDSDFPNNVAIVNIIEFNDRFVSGTFSGKISLRGSDIVLNITEGQFKARRDP